MSQGLRELTSQELNAALESVLLPKLSQLLAARELGHCMRVTDLDRELDGSLGWWPASHGSVSERRGPG